MGLLLRRRRSRGGRQGGRGVQGVEDVLPGGGERRVQRAGQHGVVWYGGQYDRRGCEGVVARPRGPGQRVSPAPRRPYPPPPHIQRGGWGGGPLEGRPGDPPT